MWLEEMEDEFDVYLEDVEGLELEVLQPSGDFLDLEEEDIETIRCSRGDPPGEGGCGHVPEEAWVGRTEGSAYPNLPEGHLEGLSGVSGDEVIRWSCDRR